MQTKKGFTLIEVVVALGILAVVIAGTVTLIVQVLNLELSARDRTEAVALAQKKLAETVASLDNGCGTGTVATPDGDEGKFNYSITITDPFAYPEGLTSDNFIKINSTVTWENKGLTNESYEVSQIVRMVR